MSVTNYIVEKCPRSQVVDFIEKYHYSKNMNGLKTSYCFKLMDGNNMIGAIVYGKIGMGGVEQKYTNNPDKILELKRLVCVDDTPKNTESYFIGSTLRWLQRNTDLDMIISYADKSFGHEGVVYKATNFEFKGETQPGRVIMYNGFRYHDKTIRTKHNGKFKPFALEIRKALENGKAKYEKTKPKNIYIYHFKKRRLKMLKWFGF
jgi:hypothetical protein|tara:strand:- start:857 stop:1471 length:615 start_codon:yes stop_codon:yes gene_type:complete